MVKGYKIYTILANKKSRGLFTAPRSARVHLWNLDEVKQRLNKNNRKVIKNYKATIAKRWKNRQGKKLAWIEPVSRCTWRGSREGWKTSYSGKSAGIKDYGTSETKPGATMAKCLLSSCLTIKRRKRVKETVVKTSLRPGAFKRLVRIHLNNLSLRI